MIMISGLLNLDVKALALLGALLSPLTLVAEPSAASRLPVALSLTGQHASAALEFRRQALEINDSPESRAALFWCAAHEYHRAADYELSDKMLDASENEDASLLNPALLLRGETAAVTRDWPAAAFYFQSLASTGVNSNITRYASRRLAITELHRRNPDAARRSLTGTGADETASLVALDRYTSGRNKRPWLGGLLGLIPGLGYAYSGEFANAGRSLILNSIFIFGMVSTAQDENWGAFAAISFFELTWYSGSIYGGIDAAHRYNQGRLDACSQGIMNNASFAPDYATLPAITLQFHF